VIVLAICGAVAAGVLGAGAAWFFASRVPLVLALFAGVAFVAAAVLLRAPTPARAGISVAVDDSCDSLPVNARITNAIANAIAPGVGGDAAVTVDFFADNARTNSTPVLDLTAPPDASVHGDAVAFANWKAPRVAAETHALTTLKTTPCRRVGTSVIGAAEGASARLTEAGVAGRRRILLVTNLVEFSSVLQIDARRFGLADVPKAVRAFAALPRPLRQPLGASTSIEILFTPAVRVGSVTSPLSEGTAVALETWARKVFHDVLHAQSVQIDVLPVTD
jgi:hypothetical protein